MQKLISRFLLSLTFLICCLSITTAQPQTEKLPEWKPAPELLSKLSKPVETEFGSIRIPLGFENRASHQKPASGNRYIWEKSSEEFGPESTLMLIHQPVTAETSRNYTLQRVLDEFIVGFSAGFDNWEASPRQYGQINGNPAALVRWSGMLPEQKVELKGSLFAIRKDTKLFTILCVQKSHDDEGIRLSEAAALTFQPK